MAVQIAATQPATFEDATRLLARGTDFLGPREVVQVFGASLAPDVSNLPPLPSVAEIGLAKELGHRLILCGPVSMKQAHDVLGNKLCNGKLLCDTAWYANEDFFLKPPVTDWHWRFTGETVIEGTLGKNYLDQTRLLAKHAKEQAFGDQPLPPAYLVAIEEFNRHESELSELMKSDWQKAAEQLAGLKLNQLCRETPDQVLWDVALHFKVNGGYLLQDKYTWTSQRSAGGSLVSVGGAGSDGVRVDGGHPRSSRGDLGVRFSRRALDLGS
ncbi:MAG: hypothetical protein A2556_01870 [Candidatus Vogelbacteria bacterium RIFOXYD2_FULL_44_9]|uniref:Uncharacterized protein n=1 Tax=Candidatus Vogelbacteria bacterium RIFOXYD2_FULL_44_9 TaxID=1802441 RepID=A0A1G2QKU2_9BACT|nr:MAG: hypothetical protein A2556_01870 [Candidatus Vogelbacteria bacterium RIFOXYD2_FULL_44_9]